jgi:hypothetical protein
LATRAWDAEEKNEATHTHAHMKSASYARCDTDALLSCPAPRGASGSAVGGDEIRRWLWRFAKLALVAWFCWVAAMLVIRCAGIFMQTRAATIDDLEHAAADCARCDAMKFRDSCTRCQLWGAAEDCAACKPGTEIGPRLTKPCQEICDMVHSGKSPFVEAVIAVADSITLCGVRPCSEVFGLAHLVATLAVLLAARIILIKIAELRGPPLKAKPH